MIDTSLDRTLMRDFAEAISRREVAVCPEVMVPAIRASGKFSRALLCQAEEGRLRTLWRLDSQANFWKPTRPASLWELPSEGFLGVTVGVYQPLPYLAAWLGSHTPWTKQYLQGADLFEVLAKESFLSREEARQAFYRFIYGQNTPKIEIRHKWLYGLRNRIRERANRKELRTGFGSQVKTSVRSSLGDYLSQLVRDVLRHSLLSTYKDKGYLPNTLFNDCVVVPSSLALDFAKSIQNVGSFQFSVIMEPRAGSMIKAA